MLFEALGVADCGEMSGGLNHGLLRHPEIEEMEEVGRAWGRRRSYCLIESLTHFFFLKKMVVT